MTPAQSKVHASITSGPRAKSLGPLGGPFGPLLHSPDMTRHIEQLGVYIRYNSAVPMRQRELAICMIGATWQADFEWYAHAPIAEAQGIPATALAQIAAGQAPDLSDPQDIAAANFVAELMQTRRVSDATYTAALQAFSEVGVVDLTALVGYYTLLAMTLNTFEVPVPEGADIPWG
jgi:4-carboxymuconolactone decarboxylase